MFYRRVVMIRRLDVEADIVLDAGQTEKRCEVCGKTGVPLIRVKDRLVCLSCAKELGLKRPRESD